MKRIFCAVSLLMLLSSQVYAANDETPESITGKITVKFGRGLVNMGTAAFEIPKQTMIMGRDYGAPGYMIGPLSGALMFGYRAIIGATESVFAMVPAPGYYDNMIDPEFVWVGWGPKTNPSHMTSDEVEEEEEQL